MNIITLKENINSIKWGREEKVTNLISRRRMIDKSNGFAYKYYMPTSPNKYIVMGSGKGFGHDGFMYSSAFGVKNGETTEIVQYLNGDYNDPKVHFGDQFFDKIGRIAVKDFKTHYNRKAAKREANKKFAKPYKGALSKEFIGKLKPQLENIAKKYKMTVSGFAIASRNASTVFPDMSLYLDGVPISIGYDASNHKKDKYYGFVNGEPESRSDERHFEEIAYSKALKEIINHINDTLEERSKNLLSSREGNRLRTVIRDEGNKKYKKEGYSKPCCTSGSLYYEEVKDNGFLYNKVTKEKIRSNTRREKRIEYREKSKGAAMYDIDDSKKLQFESYFPY